MTVVRRITAGYAGILVLVIAMVVVGIVIMGPLRTDIKDYSESALAQVQAASQIALVSATMEGTAMIAVIEDDQQSRDEAAADLQTLKATAIQALDTAAGYEAAGSADMAEIDNLRTLLDQYYARIDAALAIVSTQQELAVIRLTQEVVPLGEQLQEASAAYYKSQEVGATTEAGRLARNVNRLWIVMLVMVALVVLVGVALSVAIPRTIGKHLHTAVSGIQRSASQMLAIASQVAASAAQTAASTNQTTATVEEVKQTAILATEKATLVAESSENVARIAETGLATVEETISGIERMRAQMSVVAQTINRLSEQTQAVGDIITTVNDLAEQSNLLSVNASIEAAKAGEQGKGFTVVAQEVKNMADQSKEAVAQVRSILGEIQKASRMAVEAAEHGIEAVESSRQQSVESGEAIHKLAETATEAAQSAAQISASSRQQLAGMEQISQAIEVINEAGTQSVSGTREVEKEVQQLQDLALGLKRLVDAGATA